MNLKHNSLQEKEHIGFLTFPSTRDLIEWAISQIKIRPRFAYLLCRCRKVHRKFCNNNNQWKRVRATHRNSFLQVRLITSVHSIGSSSVNNTNNLNNNGNNINASSSNGPIPSNSLSSSATTATVTSLTNGLQHQQENTYLNQNSVPNGDWICFNFGKELYTYSYRGVKKVSLDSH
jgi:hypothetical protein